MRALRRRCVRRVVTAAASILGQAVERRPRRAASAAMLDAPLTQLEQAVARKDGTAFTSALRVLVETCNACHVAEKVEFMRVTPPTERRSVIRAPR